MGSKKKRGIGAMKKKGLFFLLLVLVITCAAFCTASAATVSMDGNINKVTIQVGETITVQYTASNADTLTYLVQSYPAESNGYGSGLATVLARGDLKDMSGTWSYTVKEGDGPYIVVYLDAQRKDPQTGGTYSSSFYRLLPVTTEKSIDGITVEITPEASSVRAGRDFTFTYKVSGGSGEYESVRAYGRGVQSNGSIRGYADQTGLPASGTVKLEKVTGEEFQLTIEAVDKKGWKAKWVSDWIPVTHVVLGKSGWVQKDGKTYYGDEYGYALEGYQIIEKEKYMFNEDGEQQTGWIKVEDEWLDFAGEDGRALQSVEGLESITIPDEVDKLSPKFFKGAARTFMIYCTPGSYAEKFALQYGLQYDNGEKTVRGCDITDLYEKIDWIVENYITDDMTDREKIQVIHNWLIYNATYDLSYTNYEPDGILLKGNGVCDSYSKAFSMIMDKLGITCEKITGQTSGGSHAWNRVWLDGQWLYLDCTWDDPADKDYWQTRVVSGYEWQYYFLVSNEFMEQNDHKFLRSSHWSRYSWSLWYGHWLCWDLTEYDYEAMAYKRMKNCWIRDIDTWYHFDAEGYMQTGRQLIDGVWYFFGEDGAMQTGWINYQGAWYYFDKMGVMKTGWIQDGNVWYYLSESGALAVGWQQIGGSWYLFSADGAMATGWTQDGGTWYYLGDSGAMQTGWIQDGDDWYYLDGSGAMVVGWETVNGTCYFFSAGGVMQTGWVKSGGSWYYLKDSGALATGWFRDKEAEEKLPEGSKKELWYYADSSGAIVTGWQEINGTWEYFDDGGLWQYTWDGQ